MPKLRYDLPATGMCKFDHASPARKCGIAMQDGNRTVTSLSGTNGCGMVDADAACGYEADTTVDAAPKILC
jgi:hypothetical protein